MFKTVNGGKLPTRATKYSAGVDVYANEDVTIGAGETQLVGLGIVIDEKYFNKIISENYHYLEKNLDKTFKQELDEFLNSHYIALKPRSSLRAKGLISHSAVIDLDYKDEIKMIIHNPLDAFIHDEISDGEFSYTLGGDYTIKKGDRIGQLLLIQHKTYLFGIESNEERIGGFGSTDNV